MRYRIAVASLIGTALLTGAVTAGTQAPAGPPATFEGVELTIDAVHAAFRSGALTCRQLVATYLARIEVYDKAGPALNTVQTINTRALQDADRLDAAFKASGPVGPLHCIPVLVKDRFTSDGLPVGIELMARLYAEPTLFRFAYAYEQATRHRRPPASVPILRR